LAVGGFAIIFDLLDVGNRVTRRSDLAPVLAVLRYIAIRLPSLLTDLLPLVVLVGALIAVVDLLRHRELVVVWGAGETRARIMLRLWPLALALVAGKFVIDDFAVPRTVPELRALRVGEFKTDARPGGDVLWLRSSDDIIRLSAAVAATGKLEDIHLFDRDAQGRLEAQVMAESAEPRDGGWLMRNVLVRPAGPQPAEHHEELFWPVTVDLDNVAVMAKLPRELSWLDLLDVVRNDGWGIAPIDGHVTWLHGRIAGMFGPGLMVFLAFALARRFSRTGMILPIFAKGLAIGFAYMIANGMLLAFGEVGLVDPVVAAWLAPAALAATVLVLGGGLTVRRPRLAVPRAARSTP
jgi:lipopolysaccharide export system permease protein